MCHEPHLGRVARSLWREAQISPAGLEKKIMSERVYWDWFAMRTDEKKDLAVVVAKCLNDEWVVLECKVDSHPMSMKQAEAQAMEKNLGAIREGKHTICIENEHRKPNDALRSELRELRGRVQALEQRFDSLEQKKHRRQRKN
jgi:hypothetical protein